MNEEKKRTELVEKYKRYGGDKSDVAEKSPDQIQELIREQKRLYDDLQETKKSYMDMDIDEFTKLCKKHDIEPLKENWHELDTKITFERLQNEMNSMADMINTKEEYQEKDMAKSVYYLEKTQGEISPDDIESINTKTAHENVVRSKFGLDPKPLKLLDDDLRALLLISGWTMDGPVVEFLNNQTPAEKDRYRERFQLLIDLRNQEINSQLRRKEKIQDIQKHFEKFKSCPTKTIKRSGSKVPEINPDYIDWLGLLKSFARDLEFRIKSFGQDVPENINEIKDKTDRLVKQHL